MDKITAGYKMLMILAQADGEHLQPESTVIQEYLGPNFELAFSQKVIAAENNRLAALSHAQRYEEFSEAMNHYYRYSKPEERTAFLQYAMNLIKADAHISQDENAFIDLLFESWDTE
jgi:uncharacterized tellurite resistance protein B-like protein